jgi:hypothetical protein
MNDKFKKQIEQFAEDNDMSVTISDNDVEFEYWSDLGEDVIFSIDISECEDLHDVAKELRKYEMNHDFDEELKAQMGISYASMTVEEVYEDAEIIDSALNELQRVLEDSEIYDYDELSDVVNDIALISLDFDDDYIYLNVGNFSREIEKCEDYVDPVINELKELYDDFSPSDFTRDMFGVTTYSAMNGLPEDIGALLQDKKEIKEHISDLADKADEMAEEIEKEQKKNKDIER